MKSINSEAMIKLMAYRTKLTYQQYRTLRGQVLAGDDAGAMRGLKKILRRKVVKDMDGGVWVQDDDRQGWTKQEEGS